MSPTEACDQTTLMDSIHPRVYTHRWSPCQLECAEEAWNSIEVVVSSIICNDNCCVKLEAFSWDFCSRKMKLRHKILFTTLRIRQRVKVRGFAGFQSRSHSTRRRLGIDSLKTRACLDLCPWWLWPHHPKSFPGMFRDALNTASDCSCSSVTSTMCLVSRHLSLNNSTLYVAEHLSCSHVGSGCNLRRSLCFYHLIRLIWSLS